MIKLTDKARNEIRILMQSSGYKNPALKVDFAGYGWGGPRMGLVLDELAENEQNIVKDNDVNIVYDGRLKNYINDRNGITIDFNNDKYGSGFIITGASTC